MKARPHPRRRADRQRQDHRRELQARQDRGRRRHPPFDKPLKKHAGFIVLKGNLFDRAIMKTSVISRGIPRALSVQPEGPERLRGHAPWCSTGRRTITTASTIRRSKIDEHTHAVHARRRRRSAIRARAEVVNMQPPAYLIKKGIHVAALHRRRPPVGHLGLALDPQRLAGSGGRRRAGAAQDRRPGAHRPQQGHRRHPDLRRGARRSAAPALQKQWRLPLSGAPDAVAGNPARHGRPARPTAWC